MVVQKEKNYLLTSETVCTKFDEEECNKKWYSARSAKEKKLTVATLYKTFYEMFPEEKKKR